MAQFKMKVNREFNEFCGRIGSNRLLVQGGGGNVSWKDDGCLWVKASGTRIGDALTSDIFVPVDLELLKQEISSGNFDASPVLLTESHRRPSIETMFHGILHQKYVVHLHEINILSYLVGKNGKSDCERLMPDELKWVFVDYHKPGPQLAEAIFKSSIKYAELDVIFLQNHGVIVADNNLEILSDKLDRLRDLFNIEPCPIISHGLYEKEKVPASLLGEFSWVVEPEINALAIDVTLLEHVMNNWALYPDHIVFLGSNAKVVELGELDRQSLNELEKNKFIFIPNYGVLKHIKTKSAELEQLLCYSDVLRRVYIINDLKNLNSYDITELIDWDAEKYRQMVAR